MARKKKTGLNISISVPERANAEDAPLIDLVLPENFRARDLVSLTGASSIAKVFYEGGQFITSEMKSEARFALGETYALYHVNKSYMDRLAPYTR